ncbi:MAG: ribonuclease HI family protein [Chloroflexi bacterium]|nr:ribonuclease HI family protein [Chloroflexota bacterium]
MALPDDLQLHGCLPARDPHHPGDPRGQLGDRGAADIAQRRDPGALDFGFGEGGEAGDGGSADAERGAGDLPPRAATGYLIRTDGAARGNPGPASSGAVLIRLDRPDARDPKARPDATISEYLGIRTNNVAEYVGVVRAVALARELGARRVELLLDSNLIVEQLHGRWRVKDAKLRPLWAEALTTLRTFPAGWAAAHVPRAQNSLADALANEAIDRVAAGGPAVVVRRPG